jgi:hypothetical protein
MCNLCDHDHITKKSLGSEYRRILGYIGTVRRKLHHVGKDHNISEAAVRAEWRSVNAIKQATGKKLRRDLRQLFIQQTNELLSSLRDSVGLKRLKYGATKPELTPFIVQTLIDWAEWFEKTRQRAEPGVLIIMEEGHKTGLNRVGVEGPDFTSDVPRVRQVLDEILEKTKRTQDTFQKITANTIQRGLSEGDDMAGIVARVADKTEEQIGFRLDRIVRTAGRGGFEAGQREAFRDAGITQLRWITERDAQVRAPEAGDKWNHRGADGQVVGIDDPFLITGRGGRSETLRFPADPLGSPGNTIYCRCTVGPVT